MHALPVPGKECVQKRHQRPARKAAGVERGWVLSENQNRVREQCRKGLQKFSSCWKRRLSSSVLHSSFCTEPSSVSLKFVDVERLWEGFNSFKNSFYSCLLLRQYVLINAFFFCCRHSLFCSHKMILHSDFSLK